MQHAGGSFFDAVPLTKAGIVGPVRGADLALHGIDSDEPLFILRSADVMRRALRSFNGIPVLLNEHKTIGTDAAKMQSAIGATGSRASFAMPFVTNSLRLWSPRALADVKSGATRQLSVGFVSQIRPVRGRSHDAEVVDLRADHVTLCDRGLVGDECSLFSEDDDWETLARVLAAALAGGRA
ncbi:MAG: DUF2213 domain-containing protein [Steroidobacteraceae bacterium]